MGMFDSVYAPCPDCGGPIEFQSKAGACRLKRYYSNSVPAEIAAALAEEDCTEICECGCEVRLQAEIPRVRMDVVRVSAKEEEDWD